MQITKSLGKIEKVFFGVQDGRIGVWFTLTTDGWGVMHHTASWDPETIEVTEHTQWTEKDRSNELDKIMRYISKLLSQAKVEDINSLKNVPVEISIDDKRSITGFRILTEVL